MGSVHPPESKLVPGYRLDRYELLCPVAEGGMASVWIARQSGKHGFEKIVAIKSILPKFASDNRFQQMFLDEARIASRIEHPNVAQIFDLGEENDILYLAMEWIDGDALSKLNRIVGKRGTTIPPAIVLRILADTCAGLHEAHELKDAQGKNLGVVHRDISPHNILVSTKGVSKLIDFGIAKARDRVAGETNAGVLKGKISYMAPEQALGREMDRRADIWAIGASMYHLLAGHPPYEGENQLATLHMLTSGRPPQPVTGVHPAIAALTTRSVVYSQNARFSTAAEMRAAIEGAMVEAGLHANTDDVAAFVNEHMAERLEKRRQSIDLALSAAAERKRIESLLQPMVDTQTTMTKPEVPLTGPISPGSLPLLPEDFAPASQGAPVSAPVSMRGSAGLVSGPASARGEPVSYATLGSAALAGPAIRAAAAAPPRSKKAIAILSAALVVAVGVAVVAFLRPRAHEAPASAATSAPSAIATTLASAVPTSEPPAPPAAATPASTPVAVDSLPPATTAPAKPSSLAPAGAARPPLGRPGAAAAPPAAPPQAAAAPEPAPAPAAPPPPAPTKKGKVDEDGF